MKRAITAFSAVALLGGVFAGGATAAKPDNPGSQGKGKAAKQCNAEKKALKNELGGKAGNTAFKATYGDPRNAMRNCKQAARNGENVGVSEFKNAAKFCKSERERLNSDPESPSFAETYGSNENKRNAFGKCVSGQVSNSEDETAEVEDGTDAA